MQYENTCVASFPGNKSLGDKPGNEARDARDLCTQIHMTIHQPVTRVELLSATGDECPPLGDGVRQVEGIVKVLTP